MNIYLTQQDGIPVYLQIINQIKQLIATERLIADQELSPIRVLAEQLLINPNTVARAYRELEIAGWIYKRRGAGTFVSKQSLSTAKHNFQKEFRQKAQTLLSEAKRMNISTDQLINIIKELSIKELSTEINKEAL